MLRYKDVFKGREEEILEKRLFNCVSASFIANPGYNYCLKFILDDVTRKEYFSGRGRDDINLPTIVISTISDDGRTITIECEPRENPNLWGVKSRMICKGIINVNSEGIIKVSEVKVQVNDCKI